MFTGQMPDVHLEVRRRKRGPNVAELLGCEWLRMAAWRGQAAGDQGIISLGVEHVSLPKRCETCGMVTG